MPKLLIKLLLIFLIISVTSVNDKRASCSSLSVNENSDSEDNDLESEKWKEKWKEQSRWRTNSNNHVPVNLITGNSKVWTNVGHARPLKRSDTNQTPIIPLVESCGGVNMTDPISKYHCPINLLYGNNLTVKNFFLMVPPSNGSLNETLTKFKSSEEREVIGPILETPQQAQQSTNEMDTLMVNTVPESTSSEWGTSTITGIVTSSFQEFVELTPSSTNATSVATMDNSTKVEEATTETWSNSNSTDALSVAEENITTITEGPSSTSPMNETASGYVYQDNSTSTPIISGNMTTLNSFDGAQVAVSITTATIDLKSEIMRTVNKYCETFNLTADNGTYTVIPISMGQQAHFFNVQDEEPNLKQISRIKKSKRNSLMNKNHRRQFKRTPRIK